MLLNLYRTLVLAFLIVAFSVRVEGRDLATTTTFSAQVVVVVDHTSIQINFTHTDDIPSVAASFCAEHAIAHSRCSHFIAVEMFTAMWCSPGRKASARAEGIEPPRTFRFLHHEHHSDSSEFSLLRPRLRHNGYVECTAGLTVSGEEDAVWLLGHISNEAAWLFKPLSDASRVAVIPGVALVNAIPHAEHLGNKDSMFRNLLRLGKIIGDQSTAFIPRTWSPDQLAAEYAMLGDGDEEFRGLWLHKDPQMELGTGSLR
jgi:hypothetical protein